MDNKIEEMNNLKMKIIKKTKLNDKLFLICMLFGLVGIIVAFLDKFSGKNSILNTIAIICMCFLIAIGIVNIVMDIHINKLQNKYWELISNNLKGE